MDEKNSGTSLSASEWPTKCNKPGPDWLSRSWDMVKKPMSVNRFVCLLLAVTFERRNQIDPGLLHSIDIVKCGGYFFSFSDSLLLSGEKGWKPVLKPLFMGKFFIFQIYKPKSF